MGQVGQSPLWVVHCAEPAHFLTCGGEWFEGDACAGLVPRTPDQHSLAWSDSCSYFLILSSGVPIARLC